MNIRKRLKQTVLTIASLMVMCGGLTATVMAQTKADICEGVGIVTGGAENCATPDGSPTVQTTIQRVVSILSIVVGVIAVIMIIIGGLRYILSGGDSNSVTSAKNTILYAIVGLIVALLAQVIVRYVLNEADPTTLP